MALYKNDIIDIELESGSLYRSFLNHSIGKGDIKANRFGVRLYRNGAAVDLSNAEVEGFFMAPDGSNILISGDTYTGKSGNMGYIDLPQACYNYEGQFSLAIKVIDSSITATMRIIDGVVNNTGVTGPVAPTEEVPTYAEIIAQYELMVEATDAANTAAENVAVIVAPAFAADTENLPGSYVTKDVNLYLLPDGHEADETWENTTKVQKTVGEQLKELTENYKELNKGIAEIFRTYPNWEDLTSNTPTNLNIGTSKRYKGYLDSVKVRCGTASADSYIYVVEVNEFDNFAVDFHRIDYPTAEGDTVIPVNTVYKHPFFIYCGGMTLSYKSASGTYKSGYFSQDNTVLTFPDDIQLAIEVCTNQFPFVEAEAEKAMCYSGENEERCYDGNWVLLNGTAVGFFGVGRLFDAGYIKKVNMNIGLASENSLIRFMVVDDTDHNYIRQAIDVSFDAVVGFQSIEIEKMIPGKFYLFTNAPVQYKSETNPTYKSMALPSGTTDWKMNFTLSYVFGMSIVRGTSRENEASEASKKPIYPYIDGLNFKTRKIVLLGDSITQGYGSSDFDITTNPDEIPVIGIAEQRSHYRNSGIKCWGNRLKEYLEDTYSNVTVINNGIGGITAYELYYTISTLVDSSVTDVILMIGTNNINESNMQRDVVQYVSYIITYCRMLGINVIAMTNTPLLNNGTKDRVVMQANLRTFFGYNIEPVNLYEEIERYLYDHDMELSQIMADNLHPNDAGYDLIYQIICEKLKL